jgi:hypothetical protein
MEPLIILRKILDLIMNMTSDSQRWLNLASVAQYFKLSNEQLEEYIDLILEMQSTFVQHHAEYYMVRKQVNQVTYLGSLPLNSGLSSFNREIHLTHEEAGWLGDLIYHFQVIGRGRCLDLRQSNDLLTPHLRQLKAHHSYLFVDRGPHTVYPSPLAIEIGTHLHQLKRANKDVREFTIDHVTIKITSKGEPHLDRERQA